MIETAFKLKDEMNDFFKGIYLKNYTSVEEDVYINKCVSEA